MHDSTLCRRQDKRRYHNKSHSELFKCPACGREARFNLNWLGNKKAVYCDGVRFSKEIRRQGDWEIERSPV